MAKSAGADRRKNENKINPGIVITLILVAALCVFMLGYTLVDNSGMLDRKTAAITAGEDTVSVTELNQYYHTTRNGFLNQYADVLSMYGYDLTGGTFDMQPSMFDNTKTWKQYFMDQAKAAALEVSLMYQEATRNGYTMSAEDQAQYDLYMQTLQDAAQQNDMSVSKYCKLLYGAGTKLSDVEAYYQKRVLTAGYYNTVVEGFGIDDAAIDGHYAANADDYDELTYNLYNVPYTTYTYDADSTAADAPKSEDEAKAKTEQSKADAKKKADELLAKMKGSDFDKVIADNAGDTTFKTGKTQTVVSSVAASSELGKWLLDEGRKAGDQTVVDNTTGYAVVEYMGRALSDDYTVAVRHTLLAFETPAQDATEEEIQAAETANAGMKAEAEALYSQWVAAGPTEESFIEMAKEHSDDGNAAQGGLYEGVYMGQMVESFQNWCFDESRQPGDHGIVESEFGYHLMYFVENEGLSYRSAIEETLVNEQYSEYLTELQKGVTVTYNDKAIEMM